MSRPRGWLGNWRPQRKTLLLIEQIQVVLQEYAAHLPLTVRQIFYRLVGAYGWASKRSAASWVSVVRCFMQVAIET